MTEIGNPILILKADGKREPFDPDKLRASLTRAGANGEVIEKVVSRVLSELTDVSTTGEIYKHAFDILGEINRPVARRYSLRRAIMDLGPSGFPFEEFVAEILKAKGFECKTQQLVLGACVPHEVDVVAWNKDKLIMVEAKFHNELGTKSDLKVALYIKARFDDLKENVFDYGEKGRHVTDSWLVTNTKFSTTAIHYGDCKGLTMIGWNYPEQGNLQDMIESETLHPITCLLSLSSADKKTLLDRKVVLCSDIKQNPQLLAEYLGQAFDAKPVLEEINGLYV